MNILSAFSEHLHELRISHKINISRLAAIIGCDRSRLQKIFGGTRTNLPDGFFDTLCETLMLSPTERKQLENEYEILVHGETSYAAIEKINSIFSDFSRTGKIVASPVRRNVDVIMTGDTLVIESKEKVLDCIRYVLDKAATQKKQLNIYAQPDIQLSEEILAALPSSQANVTMLIRFDNSAQKKEGLDNLEYFRNTLKIIAVLPQLNAMYYNDRVSEVDVLLHMPRQFITADNLVFCFSDDYENGILSSRSDFVRLYRKVFKGALTKSQPLFSKKEGIMELYKTYFVSNESEIAYCYQPCVTAGLTEEMLSGLINVPDPIAGMITKKMIAHFAEQHEQSKTYSLFSANGLIGFMESGRINEIPDSLYYPPTMRQRLFLLEQAIENLRKDVINYRVIRKESGIEPSKKMVVSVFDNSRILISLNENEKRNCFETSQNSLVEAYTSYFDWLIKSDLIMGKEETLALMESTAKKYAESLAD